MNDVYPYSNYELGFVEVCQFQLPYFTSAIICNNYCSQLPPRRRSLSVDSFLIFNYNTYYKWQYIQYVNKYAYIINYCLEKYEANTIETHAIILKKIIFLKLRRMNLDR